ncbi:MAG: 50S ribosomal protein L25 [Bacteroidia bacterium]|nr:50S ribosomal protein L25 [Bacteroidia bacterium]
MKTTELKAHKREQVGKRTAKDLRAAGNIPGVIYDEQNATHIFIEAKEVGKVLYTPETYIVNLDVDGEVTQAIVRSAEYHPVTEKILHVEFLKVSDSKKVKLTLPVKLNGIPVGVAKGGKLTAKVRKLTVKGIPAKLPEVIEVEVSHLDLGQTIKVGQAKIEGVEILTSPSAALASVEIPRSLRSTAGAATPAK